ncbi:MAG: hypothetical protein BWK79_08650 [Beggiatoa sp. IS2]|nr:MAG: hypothetical protein BWK79_08650 [Beggiatoa sp. IS2]
MTFYVRRFCQLFLLLLGVYALTIQLLAAETTSQKGLLWKIEKLGVEPSYLLGTIHSEDPRITQLPPIIEQHFTQARSVTLEILLNFSNAMSSLTSLYLKSPQSLDKLIDKEDYTQIVETLREHGMPEEAVKRLKPWATMMLISMPKSKSGEFLDLLLYQNAQKLKKPVYGLETTKEQEQVFESLSINEQIILLKETLKYLKDMPTIFDEMHKLYLERDLTAILAFSNDYMRTDEHQVLVDKFMKRLVDDRNLRMLERMQARLKEGNAFIAVGALHLPGDKGLLKLLETRGYHVSPIY